ncbi:ATP-binding protein [Salinispora tropica]|uniref:Novel STAND NTPase 1 domain-containing protein n=1 Tax=Salinispora tropica (strain ATCC BAA-916 / DSM 44818 / JCM 13857 / NBRC 105044 / CNB-440) TaxID=369723 RepID=A4X6F0_SALTO|nr:ATP-binding protein [Salinispora tropica]ABP54450.1 hypothetical protein Strop_1996 [Salinispora tropica CNB-440]
MSPRPGGEADKLGNHYEGAWIVLHVLEVLAGTAESVTVEELGEIGKGAEFTLRRRVASEIHQVKRQRGSANYWKLGDLHAEGVLHAARSHVAAGRQFHFVSTIPAQELQDLAEQARHSPDAKTFLDSLHGKAEQRFNYLSSTVYGSVQTAWETLRGTWGHWSSEREIRNRNAALAGLLLTGAPAPTAAVTLADLAVENLATTLDKQTISDLLLHYDLEIVPAGVAPTLVRATRNVHDSWKASIERELFRPSIHRVEAEQISERLLYDSRCAFAVGVGGSGKSAVLHEVVEQAESRDWAVLALRLDRQEPFSSTVELGQRFGLEASPTSSLARVARDQPSLLVIDQLDAVSKASGRMPQTFDAVADLVREATAFPNMRVLLACRKFDLENDDRIRTLTKEHQAKQVLVAELSDEQVLDAVWALGIAPGRLSRQQKAILRLPLHLKLLATIAEKTETFAFTTTRELFNAYWDQKRQDCRTRRGGTVRFADVVGALADEMSARQRLVAPVSVLDDNDLSDDADVLASEHVLIRDGQQYAFFHETFFDYAFARRWTRRDQSLVAFLLTGEQELFRRSQVRQILTYIREENPERVVTEMEALLTEPAIRYHIKHVALALLRAMDAPTVHEWRMVERLLARNDLPFVDQLWLSLRVLPWFDRLDAEGAFSAWLSGNDEQLQEQALGAMIGGVKERPDRMAALLAPHAGRAAKYPAWLRWITRFADVYGSRALFELVTEAVRRCEYDGHEHELFMSVHDLAKHQPEWAVELLAAYLVDRSDALAFDDRTRVKALLLREHGAMDLVIGAAAGTPASFSKALVPYMLKVMALTAYERDDGRLLDRHFMHRDHEPPYHELEEALAVGAVDALRKYVQQQPDEARPLLDQLAADQHEAAQWLLYAALAAAGAVCADYAVALLLDREDGLYAVNSLWEVRLLIEAISPHLSDEWFSRLEQAVMGFRPSWDSRPSGRVSFSFLSAMDEGRLSDTGRRRLGELRRLFNEEQPSAPVSFTGGFMGSPIPQASAEKMNDDQWLRAMAKHNADREDWRTLKGGARELSQVLKEEVKKDPGRFCRLALRIGQETHPAYTDAILMGLADGEAPVDDELVFQAVRHIASLNNPAHDRWLGWALRRHVKADVPADLIGILIDRAMRSTDPTDESLSQAPDTEDGDEDERDRLLERGINTARGQGAEILGDLLVHDIDGSRTKLVLPTLDQLAVDPSLAVRACVAHLIAACLRHARSEAIAAFRKLIDADDRVLATRHVELLVVYIGNGDAEIVKPVIQRMLASTYARVRRAGGRLAAYAGLELSADELLAVARTSDDVSIRSGAAKVCAGRLPFTANAAAAGAAVIQFVDDADQQVRREAAGVAATLRGRALRSFERELTALIASPSFSDAAPQLLITLDRAPDRVDDLIMKCARRFVEVHGRDAGDISTGAAADARDVGELLMRAYAQAADTRARAEVLDMLDSLLIAGAYGVAEMVDAGDR